MTMENKKLEIPKKPFADFKWKWASVQCTEGINDPVVLLGVLFRMAKLEGKYKYSSEQFGSELIGLSHDLQGTGVNVDLERRVGERNIIRNSGQYWKALNLIPAKSTRGLITLTDFGRKVANHEISQTEFSAQSIINFKLPNPSIQTKEECAEWEKAGIELHPLKLILSIVRALGNGMPTSSDAYITVKELVRIIIPLSGIPNRKVESYVEYIRAFRNGDMDLKDWVDCIPAANDERFAREYLLFLSYYGYLKKQDGVGTRMHEHYLYNYEIDAEIQEILSTQTTVSNEVVSDTERKLVKGQYRPNQARFRREVLAAYGRCVITNVEMPEVLEAAHIVPFKYHGEDTIANGFPMRMDIHYLFDAGHLRISVDGDVFLSDKARWSYGASIPPKIFIPDQINRDFLKWRWDNYNGV